MQVLKSRLLWSTAIAFSLFNTVEIPLLNHQVGNWLNIRQEALAKKSGGRSGGGSFSRPSRSGSSAPSRSNNNSGSSAPSRSNNSGSSDDRYYHSAPVYNSGYSSGGIYYYSGWGWVLPSLFGLIVLTIVLLIVVNALKNANTNQTVNNSIPATGNKELDNNIVTISKIQVGLLAQAREVQRQLTKLSLDIDTSTPEGISQLLQESALALLRSPENWTHVSAMSKTVRSREEAQTIFNKFSIEERSKFSSETLTNVEGKVRQSQVNPHPDAEPGSYIVVTLLIGTEDDRPLFVDVYSSQDLKQALEKVAAKPPEYLTVFELLWTPQSETESLTYDEMLTEYPTMMQIV